MAAESPSTTNDRTKASTSDEPSGGKQSSSYAANSYGIEPSNNFLGLLPPPYSMSTLKTSLPLFQNSSYTNTHTPMTTTNTNTNTNNSSNSSGYRLNTNLTSDSTSIPYSMASSTYRSSSISFPKPPLFHQTREKEKFELSTLNDKFADYVEKVRYLEAQNKKIQMENNLLVEKQQGHCQRVKSMFEDEISQLKELIEKLFKDKNSAAYAAKESQNGISPLKQRLNQTFKDADSSKYETEKIERQLSSIEGDIMMFKRRLTHQDGEHNQWKQLITHIQRLLLQAKNETHNESLTRTSCEQATKQLRLDIEKFREQQQQKLKDLKQNTFAFGPNANNDRAHMFKSELSSAIRKIRQDYERENDQQRNNLYAQFTQSYENIAREHPDIGHLFLNEREQERIRQEEDRIRNEIQRIRADTNQLKQKNAELKLRTREIQINLEMSLEENKRFEQLQQNEIEQLKSKQERVTKDYDEVISKQTSLEKEIETYRNLLEGTMKTVVDTITEEYNSATANQTKPTTTTTTTSVPTTNLNYTSTRSPRSVSVDRNSSSPYMFASRLNGHYSNAYTRYTNQKYNSNETTNSPPVTEIPTTINGNGITTSKSANDLTLKNGTNGLQTVEINGIENDSSVSTTRSPTILQTRRN